MQIYNHAADVEVIALDPQLEFASQFLIQGSSLADKVVVTTRDSITGSGQVTEVAPGDLPITAWSHGEQVLWLYLASLAGLHCIDLNTLAGYFRGTPDAHRIIATFVALIGDGR